MVEKWEKISEKVMYCEAGPPLGGDALVHVGLLVGCEHVVTSVQVVTSEELVTSERIVRCAGIGLSGHV